MNYLESISWFCLFCFVFSLQYMVIAEMKVQSVILNQGVTGKGCYCFPVLIITAYLLGVRYLVLCF